MAGQFVTDHLTLVIPVHICVFDIQQTVIDVDIYHRHLIVINSTTRAVYSTK